MTDQQREDAYDALMDLKEVIQWLEAGESTLEEVARVWLDNIHYLSPMLALALPRRGPGSHTQHQKQGAA